MMTDLPKLPGQEIEKAMAEVTSAAGRSLVDGVGRVFNAWVAKKSAGMEAEAAETKLNATHKGDLERRSESEDARRRFELEEIEHRVALRERALQQRAIGRVAGDFVSDQLAIEQVVEGATLRIEQDPDNDHARPVEPDWLRRFFRYASSVDEKTILEVFSAALADAAIAGRPVMPPRALDALRFFEPRTFDMFSRAARLIALFGHSEHQLLSEISTADKLQMDLDALDELGLVKQKLSYYTSARIGSFYITFSFDIGTIFQFEQVQLTGVGQAILHLIDKPASQLVDDYRDPVPGTAVLATQTGLGLSRSRVRTLARKLLAQVSDAPEIEIVIKQEVDGNWDIIASTFRKKRSEPLKIGKSLKRRPNGPGADMIEAFIDIFDDFDANTLPAMGLGPRRARREKL